MNRGPTFVVKTSGFPLFVVVRGILVGGHDGCQRNPAAVTKCDYSSRNGITDRNRSIVENGERRKQLGNTFVQPWWIVQAFMLANQVCIFMPRHLLGKFPCPAHDDVIAL